MCNLYLGSHCRDLRIQDSGVGGGMEKERVSGKKKFLGSLTFSRFARVLQTINVICFTRSHWLDFRMKDS